MKRLTLSLSALSAAFLLAACGQPSSESPAASAPPPMAANATLTPEQVKSVEDFYSGKTITIIVGSGAGGGFDSTARIVSRHLSRHLPGSPVVIVQNMPGGGGMVAANHIYNAAVKDGTVFGTFHEVQVMNQVTGAEGVQFDVRKFNWLASAYVDPNVCVIRSDQPVTTFKDMIGLPNPIAVGGTGPGSNTWDAPKILAAATGANLKAVSGYPTTNEVRVGVERGEIQGICVGWESIKSGSRQWLEDKYVKVVVQNGLTPHADLPDVPLAIEFAKDETSRTLLKLVDAPGAMSKPYAMPPGVDPVRVQAMRKALLDTFKDPAFLEEGAKLKLDFVPKDADQIAEILEKALATPPEIADKYREIVKP